jgi:predicted  nucleic acid-binding Zn-ribbon protein
MVVSVDRDAIARAQRRRQAEEALEAERDRMEMLASQVEELVAELLGARIDDEVFARMAPEDAATVRELLGTPPDFEVDEEWAEDESAGEESAADDEPAEAEDPAAEIEAEISRLESEIAISRQRQQALERYLAALGG